MKLGIISDTHDRKARTAQAMTLLLKEQIEGLIHCGDVTTPEIVLECAGVPSYFVFGNNDWDTTGLSTAMNHIGAVCLGRGGEITLGGRRIAVTHGDQVRELRRLTDAQPDLLFYGHTHVVADFQRGPTRWINPGALHRASRWTVATLELDDLALRILDVDSVD